jgi:hypothetical protein
LLKECNQEAEISVLFPLPNRPTVGRLEPIHSVNLVFDQDTNKPHYMIDIGIGQEARYQEYQQDK